MSTYPLLICVAVTERRMQTKFQQMFDGGFRAVEMMQSFGEDNDISSVLAVALCFQLVNIDLEVYRFCFCPPNA